MPYYPDARVNKKYGSFQIWNWWHYKDQLISDAAVKAYLSEYFKVYVRPNGSVEERIAVISTERNDPVPTDISETKQPIGRFSAACMFSHLVRNPTDPERGYQACSSDNFMAFYQPFDPNARTVALQHGSYFRGMDTAASFDHLRYLTPQYMPCPVACVPDQNLLGVLADLARQDSDSVRRLFRSFDWVRLALSNVPELPYESRIVSLTTAFEILCNYPKEKRGNTSQPPCKSSSPFTESLRCRDLLERSKSVSQTAP